MTAGLTRMQKIFGFFLLAIISISLCLILLIFAQGKGWFQSHRTYLIQLPQGYNLRQGSPVKILNTEVGKVSEMQILSRVGAPYVRVTIEVLPEYAHLIREKSVAKPVSSVPSGSEYVSIIPGPPEYPSMKEYGTLPVILPKSSAPDQ